VVFRGWKSWRRRKITLTRFPASWLEILERQVPYYRRLPEPDKVELQNHIKIFISEKHFEGCGGLVVTEEMKVVVAAQACLLLLHRSSGYFPKLQSIVLYPHSYVVKTQRRLPGGVVSNEMQTRHGESWGFGTIVLAWDDVMAGARDVRDGHNVVMHEFAHQLDAQGGRANGTPELELKSQYTAWARILSEDFLQLNKDTEKGRKTVMDMYGATNPAEFFAVATETFFEKPVQLKRKHPALYDELNLFYRQDPASFCGVGPVGQC